MPHDNSLSEEESLRIIQSMINKAKNDLCDNGHLYRFWGWLILGCSLLNFLLLNFYHWEYHYTVWSLAWLGTIYTMIYSSRKRNKRGVRTYMDEMISYIWIVFVILMFTIGFVLAVIMGKQIYLFINPVTLVLYGMPTFLSGKLLRFRPLVVGAISCWLLSIACAFADPRYHVLFLAMGVILAWIIPGYILRAKYSRQLSAGN